jgi:hypothetical protein
MYSPTLPCAGGELRKGAGAQVMTSLHQFSAFAESRGEGLHPKLRALMEIAAASPFSKASLRHDGMIQAGPSPESEIVASRASERLLSREPACPVVPFPKPEMRRGAATNPKRERVV